MNKILVGGLLGLSLFVVGCGSENVNSSDMDSEVVTESNENTESMYKYNTATYAFDYTEFANSVYNPIMANENYDKEDLINRTNAFLLYTQEIDFKPVTDADYMLKEHFDDFVFDAKSVAEYSLDYLYKGDSVYKDFMKNSYSNAIIKMDTIVELEKKYYQ